MSEFDVADLADEHVRKQLVDLWNEVGVIVFRQMRASVDTHLALSRCFGELRPHPVRENWVDGHPEIINVGFRPYDGDVYEVNGERLGAWLPWHSDLIYMDKINRGGILRPIELPASGGQTRFIDKIAAYTRLSAQLQKRIEGLHVIYQFNLNAEEQKFGRTPRLHKVSDSSSYGSIQARIKEFPASIHPMVYKQPQTLREVLNVSPWFALGIMEMPDEEGDALLRQVIECCSDEQYAYFHDWRPNDMVLRDNWRVLHSSRGCPWHSTRLMQRTTFVGDYALGATLLSAHQQVSNWRAIEV